MLAFGIQSEDPSVGGPDNFLPSFLTLLPRFATFSLTQSGLFYNEERCVTVTMLPITGMRRQSTGATDSVTVYVPKQMCTYKYSR